MKKETFRKILTIFGILVIGISLFEAVFIIDSIATKSKSNEEIAQTFTDFLSNKQYYRAYHLMCNGPAAQSPLTGYLVSSSIYGLRNTERLVFDIKNVYENPGRGQSKTDLKIYPESRNLQELSPNFGIIRNSQSLFSPCISTQAG